MKRYYDKENNRLVYIDEHASSEFWDNKWQTQHKLKSPKKAGFLKDYVVRTTQKFLHKGVRILEGGCGNGHQVLKLHQLGYDVVGLDYAQETVANLQKNYSDITFQLGDVRELPFENESFDGYWSFGVIEHFYHGYDAILDEMSRIIKPGGYLFLTFPHMSALRQRNARKQIYPTWQENKEQVKNFYQFALDEQVVMKDLKQRKFKLVGQSNLSGYKGLKDELRWGREKLQVMYDSKFIGAKIMRHLIDKLVKHYSSHTILLVMQKL